MAEELEAALPGDVCDLAERILGAIKDAGWQLATAESCTGGLLAALFTDVPGYSHVFDRGFVAYSDQAKCDLLGLADDLVASCGAVSRAVAEAMAVGALDRSQAQLAISITGFAGPAGEGDEEGLVHFALAGVDGSLMHREEHFGPIGRDGVRIAALRAALDMLREKLGLPA
jgi:nicotinamide-nucleotide amidase